MKSNFWHSVEYLGNARFHTLPTTYITHGNIRKCIASTVMRFPEELNICTLCGICKKKSMDHIQGFSKEFEYNWLWSLNAQRNFSTVLYVL